MSRIGIARSIHDRLINRGCGHCIGNPAFCQRDCFFNILNHSLSQRSNRVPKSKSSFDIRQIEKIQGPGVKKGLMNLFNHVKPHL